MEKKERNPNIELWRCICMFAVVLGHVVVNNHVYTMNGYMWHIPGFLLISGYFGIRFSFRKIFRLIATAYVCYWMTIPLHGSTGLCALLLPHGGWFLPFYCVMMMMSPLLNSALENARNQRSILILISAMLVIGWLPTLTTNVHVHMLAVSGMQGNGLLLMIATYVLGAMMSKHEVAKHLNAWIWFTGFVIGIVANVVVGLFIPSACNFTSPISLATAIFGILFFVSIPPLPTTVGRVVNFISPSMFGVCILHECCINKLQIVRGGGNVIVRAIALFALCVAIDMIRRLLEWSLCLAFHRCRRSQGRIV